MSSTIYDRVYRIISKSPQQRRDAEIRPLLAWFRQKSELFRSLSPEVLHDLIKMSEVTTVDVDDVIIKQGDVGDRFYVILCGTVSVYINNAMADEEDPTKIIELSRMMDGDIDRTRYGNCVAEIGIGKSFGELALINANCIRNASILANERTDLLVVDRELYNRCLHSSHAAEYEEKNRFVENHPLFRGWPQQHRRQLAMSIQRRRALFDEVIIRQGDDVNAMYFILRGQGKVIVEPAQHVTQYPTLVSTPVVERNVSSVMSSVTSSSAVSSATSRRDVNETKSTSSLSVPDDFQPRLLTARCPRRRQIKRQLLEVCLVGVNDILGDVEFSLGLKTYLQSVVSTETCDVYALNMRNYERLVVRRHPPTAEVIQNCVQLKLLSRMSRLHHCDVPLFQELLAKMCSGAQTLLSNKHKGNFLPPPPLLLIST